MQKTFSKWIVAAVVALMAVVMTPSMASAGQGWNRLIQNQWSRKCLEISYGSTADFAPAGQYYCYGGPVEQWNYDTQTGWVVNVNSRKCLEVPWSNGNNYVQLGQYACHGGSNQLWTFNPNNGLIANRLTGKCIEVFSTADFAGVYQNTCSGAPGQKWWW
ncbi:RICIN domain-containing protein [Catellatospora coxensis]|uniref:Ricin B lectin domain-containing protein n=1 Tax=Catellatospora coxensis TaxID=310354 RepID=A0A8J3KXS5_9ACTN|nr:RICIN domain-containing protein [Catellatospora coxensis]GIG05031.1 hypothetical protein Cco03nite_17310 [Catellatospora coxensis]